MVKPADPGSRTLRTHVVAWGRRPLGRWAIAILGLWICLVPAWLCADLLEGYWIYGDDWEYVASSRTFLRAIENLLRPHNVHIVPVWRIVSWSVVALAGKLEHLQKAMAAAAYGTVAAVLILTGRLIARETRRVGL